MKPPRRLQPPKPSEMEWRAIGFALENQAWLSDYLYDERVAIGRKVREYLNALADQSSPSPPKIPHL